MAYDFMAISQERVPAEIKDHITMYKPYRTDGNSLGGTIQLDNGRNYFIVPDENNGFIAKRVYLRMRMKKIQYFVYGVPIVSMILGFVLMGACFNG